MNKMNLVIGLLAVGFLSGCVSMHERLAKKVGCTKEESKVERTLLVPAYEEYSVQCKNVEYKCNIAPFTEVCNPVDKPVVAAPAKTAPAKTATAPTKAKVKK
ncbi:MAG: carboxymuconolactone decarboxylase family protein [Bdellovibrionaceae bacterium]|nr:carboxymuconolactone decarboxylase family protein [Bdellovibrio sp.]